MKQDLLQELSTQAKYYKSSNLTSKSIKDESAETGQLVLDFLALVTESMYILNHHFYDANMRKLI